VRFAAGQELVLGLLFYASVIGYGDDYCPARRRNIVASNSIVALREKAGAFCLRISITRQTVKEHLRIQLGRSQETPGGFVKIVPLVGCILLDAGRRMEHKNE